jgi:O-antigen/teichoic acid export membrane protein
MRMTQTRSARIIRTMETVDENRGGAAGEFPPVEDGDAGHGLVGRLMRTFSLQSVDLVLRTVQQLLVVPVLIRHWGTELYQDWIVLFSAANFLVILDLGMQTYFVNSLLIAWSRRDHCAFKRHIGVAMTLYVVVLLIAVAALGASMLVVPWPAWLGIKALSSSGALRCGAFLIVGLLALIPLGIFTGVYRVRGDYSLSVATVMFTQIATGYVLCAIAMLGGSPESAAAMYLFASAAAWILVAADQRRRYGAFSLSISAPTESELRMAAAKSAQYTVPGIAAPIVQHFPVILLGMWGAAGAVLMYSIVRILTGLVRQITLQPNYPVGLEMSRLYAGKNIAGVGKLFSNAGHVTSGISGLFGGFILAAGEPAIRVWTNGQVAYDPWLTTIFVGVIVIGAPAQVAFILFYHINRPRMLVLANGGHALGTMLLCLVLVPKYAALGAAAATGLTELVFVGLLLPFAACRLLAMPVVAYFANCGTVAIVMFFLSYTATWAMMAAMPVHDTRDFVVLGGLWAVVLSLPAYFLVLTSSMRRHILDYVVAHHGLQK